MRLGQGLPTNMIVLTALGLLALVVIATFFISGFGEASGSVNVVEADQAECQSLCQSINMLASNYRSCAELTHNTKVHEYAASCALQFGTCKANIRGGVSCTCGPVVCAGNPEEECDMLCSSLANGVSISPGCGTYDSSIEFNDFSTYCEIPSYSCVVDCNWNGCDSNEECLCYCTPAGCAGTRNCV